MQLHGWDLGQLNLLLLGWLVITDQRGGPVETRQAALEGCLCL